jgi:hypothetical protein
MGHSTGTACDVLEFGPGILSCTYRSFLQSPPLPTHNCVIVFQPTPRPPLSASCCHPAIYTAYSLLASCPYACHESVRVEKQLHQFSKSALRQVMVRRRCGPFTHRNGTFGTQLGPKWGLATLKREIFCHWRESKPDSSDLQSVAW